MQSKSLNNSQPLFVIVIGVPGSGKSFFARQFAEQYKFFYIDTGRYEVELDAMSDETAPMPELAKKLAVATFEEAIKSFKHIILEGSFGTFKEREKLIYEAKSAGFAILTVWVQTDLDTAEERALNRDRRRADDRNSVNITSEQFDHNISNFQKPVAGKETFVVISGKHSFRSQSLVVLKKIAALLIPSAARSTISPSPSNSTATQAHNRILR